MHGTTGNSTNLNLTNSTIGGTPQNSNSMKRNSSLATSMSSGNFNQLTDDKKFTLRSRLT